jgi:heme exporter protein B
LPTERSSSPAAVWAILRKECRSEWRTRYGLNAALLFAVTSLTSVSFAVGRLGDRPDVLSALLWVVLLFAALASLSHTFVREVEGRTMILLRLIASPTAIATGKLLFNLLFLGVIELVTVPLFLILMGAPAPAWGPFLGVLTLGSLALGTGATLVGAIIAQTRGRAALFAGVSFPILLPVVAAAVSATRAQWSGGSVAAELRLLAAYGVALLAASLLLYDHLWED